jgi:hypothetical protein
MTNRLRLPWKRHSKGYEIIHFDPSSVDWDRMGKSDRDAAQHNNLTVPKPKLHDDQGELIQYGDADNLASSQVIAPMGNKIEKFDPIEKSPKLYLMFANTPCSIDGILEFANKNGLLTKGEENETVDQWAYNITQMRKAISMWEHVREKNPAVFAKTYRRLCPCPENNFKHLLQEDPPGTLKWYLEPENLLAAMWFQFSGAIDGVTSFSTCAECSVLIDTVPGSNRPDKIYCSDACKMRAYRKRKARK